MILDDLTTLNYVYMYAPGVLFSTHAWELWARVWTDYSDAIVDGCVYVCTCVPSEVKEVASTKGQKTAAAAAARGVDISRLDIRVGHIVSAEKVGEAENRKSITSKLHNFCHLLIIFLRTCFCVRLLAWLHHKPIPSYQKCAHASRGHALYSGKTSILPIC